MPASQSEFSTESPPSAADMSWSLALCGYWISMAALQTSAQRHTMMCSLMIWTQSLSWPLYDA